MCFAYYGKTKVSTTEQEKPELFEAGFGEKEVKFTKLDMNATQFCGILYGAFPELANGGGFQP